MSLGQRAAAVVGKLQDVRTLKFAVNDRLSYDVEVNVVLDGTSVSSSQRVRLDDQMYHYLTPGQPQVPRA